jgi:hypothetical protein
VERGELGGNAVQTSRKCLKGAAVAASQARDVSNRMPRVRNHLVAQDKGQQSSRTPSGPRTAQVLARDGPQQAGENGTDRDRMVRVAHLPFAWEVAAVTERCQ